VFSFQGASWYAELVDPFSDQQHPPLRYMLFELKREQADPIPADCDGYASPQYTNALISAKGASQLFVKFEDSHLYESSEVGILNIAYVGAAMVRGNA